MISPDTLAELELLQEAEVSAMGFAALVANAMGCTCAWVLHDAGYLHRTGCQLAHPANYQGEGVYWTPTTTEATHIAWSDVEMRAAALRAERAAS